MGKRNGVVVLETSEEDGEVGDSKDWGGGEAARCVSCMDNVDIVGGAVVGDAKGVEECIPSS
jgi:hypothetical protein